MLKIVPWRVRTGPASGEGGRRLYQHKLDAAFFAERDAEAAPRENGILKECQTIAKAPESILLSRKYPDSLIQQIFGRFLDFTYSRFSKEEELQAEESQTLWNVVIIVGDEPPERGDEDVERTQCASTRELVMECSRNDGSGVWAAWTRAGMGLLLGWLAAAVKLKQSGISPSSLFGNGERLLLTQPEVEAQMRYKDFAARNGKSPEYFLTATGEAITHICITPRSHLHLHHIGSRRKLSREALAIGKVRISPAFATVDFEYEQHADNEC